MWGNGKSTGGKEKFTLEHLRSLNDVLLKHAVVSDANKDVLVETFRALAELLTWGDQHEPALFDYFVEKRMLAHFVRVLVQCAPGSAAGSAPARGACTALAVQLLQSLSILTANTRRETSIYYLFSNNYLNDLLALKQFDYGVDEEVLAWYISFLKAISLQLNEHTIQFFVGDAATPADGAPGVPAAFPLYAQVIRFVQHGDSMVRAAARAATLNVFRVDDPAARSFVLAGPERGYFASLAASLLEQSIALSATFAAPAPDRWSAVATAVAKLGDLLCYCNDVLDLQIEGISSALTGALWQGLVEPLLMAVAPDAADSAASQSVGQAAPLSPTAALYVLSRLCFTLTYRPLLMAVADALLGTDGGNRQRRSILHTLAACSPAPDAVAALCLLAVLAHSRHTDDIALDAVGLLPLRRRASMRAGATPPSLQPTDQTLTAAMEGVSIVAASVDRHNLAAAEQSPTSAPEADAEPGAGAPVSATFDAPEARPETSDAAGGDASAPSRTDAARAAQQEVMDALVAFIVACEQLQGGAHLQAVSYAVWLLRVLVEAEHAAGVPAEGAASAAVAPRACLVSEADAVSLRAAASSAAAALTRHLREPWADAVVPLLCAQWPLARRVGETPCLGDEHVASLVFANAAASLTAAAEPAPSVVQPGPRSAAAATASAAERALVSVRRYLVLRGACAVLAGATLGDAPPLASLPEAFTLCSDEMREGATSPVGTPDGVPCRVAFERGKERRVLLTAAPCRIAPAPSSGPGDRSVAGVTTMLLLVEGSAAQPGAGAGAADGAAPAVPPQAAGSLVHAVAPAAGAEPYSDTAHRKWLHLRVRPSITTLLACAALPAAPGAPPCAPGWAPPPPLSAARRLQDGHWTLAFASEELCQDALRSVCEHAQRLREVCYLVLAPLAE